MPLIGSSLFPKADTPQFLIQVEAPNGTSLAETDRALRFVEDELAKMPEVKSWFANLGHGNPQIYYNHIHAQRRRQLRRGVRAAARVRHRRNAAAAATRCATELDALPGGAHHT